ncbi:MAG: type IV pili twitching motility protein PilT [Candidatus Yanofskybacteria bacterium RIFCSPHIGHO2_02_FULL_41_29]|uniref:Type IV pili twitching motility protein PilT n=1 Tax=Candidatus Yanofskybacteria bacterium RIFCSPHIGHO2_01_FULL_41_53 TaxID=1802663 RepID=A0A1F8EKN0_9BACT|nr:MAG: type IV pili twitching motility protein PilT [Candidatus Yanofskybacteria bacterium RIFCSPHIGHO2_01_FULL_41_53]OGN10838.1 MAG: type IV pili twitching motility protein PilT [Candidatus Yanofskybacteria bacterium RIFCSPHIGHO2_02_FULL_41_29]OGN18550.1 MAG: type IV pili twitching motility protein PilT [Candidatus Yanofskybacteria bacterium RIFCSPHIGHO2_12_FULL_41_9]OGN24498.1 MAG: type IV pili twitching motility protein PilT [Candidatus Yanofskybacteria bacterium RIFCSPLOWO2_01_FULL_41_67]O
MSDFKQQLEDLLMAAGQNGASDIHLSPGNYPILRIDGRLIPLSNKKILDSEILEGLASVLLGDERKTRFVSEKEIDFSYESSQGTRFRVNVYYTQGRVAATLRLVPNQIKSIEDLNLPEIIKVFAKLSQGFVLVVGPNGHGKSTTLAAIIDLINKERSEKIITIEDPIEYIFNPEKSIIDQREVYQDTFSFHKALRSAFRENVNVVMVGEMRDYETMSAAVTAAETGHLVFGSLHTNSASQTVERIIDTFPPNQQSQIRNQLANTISGIISQRLIPRIKGGLIPAVEVMIANPAVRTLIRDNRPRQLDLVIETSQESGMISLNRSLADLVRRKEISLERAQFYSQDPSELKELIR